MKKFVFVLSALSLIFSGMPTPLMANHAVETGGYYAPVCVAFPCDGPVRRVVRGAGRLVGRTAIGAARIVRGAAIGAARIVRGTAIGAARIVRGTAIGAARIVRGAAIGAGRVVAGTGRLLFGRRRAF